MNHSRFELPEAPCRPAMHQAVQVGKMTKSTKDTVALPDLPLRANAYPKEGFSMVVDGRFKQHFVTLDDAQKAAMSLKVRFPLLQVAVRDAVTAERSPVDLPE